MKAITLWQPYASLIAAGEKTIETRSWSTNYRGPLAIHAGQTFYQSATWSLGFKQAVDRVYGGFACYPDTQPLGALLCEVDLIEVVPTEAITWIPDDGLAGGRSWGVGQDCAVVVESQRLLGDYSPGRYAWLLSDPRPLERPIPWRGQQGLWTVPRLAA